MIHTIVKSISPKVFELAYFIIAVQQVNHYTTGNPLQPHFTIYTIEFSL